MMEFICNRVVKYVDPTGEGNLKVEKEKTAVLLLVYVSPLIFII